MEKYVQAAVGIVVLLIVVGGLLRIFYARTNAVQKTGYGALTMLALVSVMIPVFWIMEGGNQLGEQNKQQALAIDRGLQLYAQFCINNCYGIDKDNHVVDPKYNGYTMAELNQMSEDNLHRVISAGVYNPKAPAPANPNAVPRSDQYGGQLLSNYVDYLAALIHSADPTYAKKNGFSGEAAINGFSKLPDYLQANNPNQYKAAVSQATLGRFGAPVDMTAQKKVTINIADQAPGQACNSSCYDPINVQVKVGTVITWVNKSMVGHTVTAIVGTDTATHKAAPEIFDSGIANLIPTGKNFTYTVTDAAYNFNPDHTVIYYCAVHPDMVAKLIIVK
ncbi:MAG: hypothetical protein E6J34_06575 [Chloroflexi bacterium]|nr:MAG: hypothetical protein E6J34_06575 [Chloroflexota bacterium]